MILSALLLAATATTAGQHSHAPAQTAPVYAHHVIATTDPVSQALFDRGLTLYYAYNGSEGAHVFRALQAREPNLAMAYWGEALSDGPDINTSLVETNFNAAHAAIEKAAALENGASPAERAYIDAMRLRYSGPWSEHEKAESAYRAAMASAVAKFPLDDDLASLYVEALLENSGLYRLWKPGTSLAYNADTITMVNTLDAIVARDPQHLMANHLIIHIFEMSTDRARAVLAAGRMDAMPFAPEDEHLRHMSAHTYIDVGQYAQAVTASSRAVDLFDQYLATPGTDPAHKGYIWHDLQVGYMAAMMLGNFTKAHSFATRLAISPRATANANVFALTAARFDRWADLKNITPTGATDPTHFALAYAKLEQGDAAGAKLELVGGLDTKSPMSYLLYALRGSAETALGDRADAESDFKKAQDLEKQHFSGEYIPLFPTGEIAGAAYYRAGNYDLAETTYRSTLERYPNDARALFGLSQTLAKEGKTVEAKAAAKQFAAVWTDSDTTLSPATL